MTKEKVIPQIRFSGFTDTWEQRELGECFSERVESMPDGELISVTINDGIKKFSELGRHDNSNDDKSKYKKVCIGDIAYNSMRMWQGASGYSPYEGIVSPAYTVLSPNSNIYSKCVAYQFKLPQTIHIFQINSQGITSDNWNLKYPALSKIKINVSRSLEEQRLIAEFFTHLDRLITLHQRKYDKLTKVKKAMLEKMFPKNGSLYPEIRFKGFTDAWEQREVSNVAMISTGGTPSTAINEYWNPKQVPWLSSGEVHKKYITYTDDKISNEGLNHSSARMIKQNSVLIALAGQGKTRGTVAINRISLSTNQSIAAMTFAPDICPEFVFSNLESRYDELRKVSSGDGTRGGLNKQLVSEIQIPYTSLNEQRKIGQFFTHLDRLITLHQRKLEKLKNIKKACLEKMFV